MPVVTVEAELYRRVEEVAQEQKSSIDEILAEAVRLYLWEQERQKIDQESAAFRRQHVHLKAQYLGEYIAMHEGQVVDHDMDFAELRRRVRQSVMITLVEDQLERPLVRRRFQIENGNSYRL